MIIPHAQLSADALRGVIEEYVTRDGTEFAEADDSAEKVRQALKSGELVLVFDEESQSCNLVSPDDIAANMPEEERHWTPDA